MRPDAFGPPRARLLAGLVALVVLGVGSNGKRRQERIHRQEPAARAQVRDRSVARREFRSATDQLEPERKIEILLDERDDTEADESAAPPAPPASPDARENGR